MRPGRSLAFATDMTISSPRSIASILEYFPGLGGVEYQLVVVNLQVDWKPILQLERERRPSTRNTNITRGNRNAHLFSLLNDIRPEFFSGFSGGGRELHFLPDEIIEFECREVGRNVLICRKKKNNQHQQNEDLSAVQAKHGAKL